MSGQVRVLTEPLGGSPLALRAAAGAPPQWYAERPRDAAAWAERCRSTRSAHAPGWLDAIRPAFGSSIDGSAAGARLARSAESAEGVVVTTGQQPGLFGGPVYTWSKALSALALADALEAVTGCPVAPVFWAATDDADFAEASTTVVSLQGGPRRLSIARQAADGLPMSRMPLGADTGEALEWLVRAAGSASFGDVLEIARAAYAPGNTVGGAYLALLRTVLEPLGIAILDASHEATRSAAHALLREALRSAEAIDAALAARVGSLEREGYEPQVPLVRGLSLVFTDEPSGKLRVPLAAAARRALEAPTGSLSPNVLLRPVVEREVVPTVAYVAGPGEIAYFAEVGAVAAALGRDLPLAVPRWSCTLVEPHVARLLTRLGLDVADLADPHAAETRLARGALPESLSQMLAALRDAIESHLSKVRDTQAARARPLLTPATIDGAERSLLRRLERLERRAVAAQKRESDAAMRDVATARGALFPFGVRQERALNLLPTLARYGPSVLAAMRDAAAAHAARLAGDSSAPDASGSSEARGGVATG